MFRIQNFYEHPTQKKYMVYEFRSEEMAIYFEQKLILADIEFEKGEETRRTSLYYLYGVPKKFNQEVYKMNTEAIIKYKPAFMPNKAFKWFVLILTVSLLSLALVGYFISNA